MLGFLNVTIHQKSPAKEVIAFQLLAGDISLLKSMLPSSGFVSTLELGSAPNVSIRSITEFKNELMYLDESVLPETDTHRSGYHPEFGTVNASDLRRRLVEAIDEALRSLKGVVSLSA